MRDEVLLLDAEADAEGKLGGEPSVLAVGHPLA
jgi:hypothetical protein